MEERSQFCSSAGVLHPLRLTVEDMLRDANRLIAFLELAFEEGDCAVGALARQFLHRDDRRLFLLVLL